MSYQLNTINNATAGTGFLVPFTPSVATVTLTASAEMWVKANGSGGAAPASSPVTTGLVSGYIKLSAGDKVTLGVDGRLVKIDPSSLSAPASPYSPQVSTSIPVVSPGPSVAPDQIASLSVWAVANGDLKIAAH